MHEEQYLENMRTPTDPGAEKRRTWYLVRQGRKVNACSLDQIDKLGKAGASRIGSPGRCAAGCDAVSVALAERLDWAANTRFEIGFEPPQN